MKNIKNRHSLDTYEIEIASAKTIADITKNLSEKIEACSCYKQDKNSKKGKYKSLQFYSPPNIKETIGNKDLLIKENTSQLINWPSKKWNQWFSLMDPISWNKSSISMVELFL